MYYEGSQRFIKKTRKLRDQIFALPLSTTFPFLPGLKNTPSPPLAL